MARRTITLTGLFTAAILLVALGVGALSFRFVAGARRTLLERAERQRQSAAEQVQARIERELGEAGAVVEHLEALLAAGALDDRSPEALEGALFSEVLAHAAVAEVTFTRGAGAPGGPWQVSLLRARDGAAMGIDTRVVRARAGGGFVGALRERAPGEGLGAGRVRALEDPADPSDHPTFSTAASPTFRGQALWSDLHWAQPDLGLPPAERRVVVGVQKALLEGGALVGVVRVELLAAAVDGLARLRVEPGDPDDPHQVFLCDRRGRLLTRLSPGDRIALDDGDLRLVPAAAAPGPAGRRRRAVALALASPALAAMEADAPPASTAFTLDGHRHLATFRALPGSQGWIAGIVVPEDHYTADLRALVTRFAVAAALALLLWLLAIAGALRVLSRGFARVLEATARMRAFDFAPAPLSSPIAELADVGDGLERARTALRAMARYVPVDLVRRLYAENQEPRPGGELRPLTLLFTDIEGFTTLAERLPPADLAAALGAYLDAMTSAITATSGTIDKFIGDSVMAFWNAPARLPDHAARACRAALDCERATTALFASEAWRGRPPLRTRFGLHTAEVLVGHFGSRDRLAYTALGDGVNLASRLEGLCKAYGVTCLVSEDVVAAAGPGFCFRRLDRVAVKGKTRAVTIHELCGLADERAATTTAATYEAALDHYFAGRFADALAGLEPILAVDPPAQVLAGRCAAFVERPPPPGWDGTFVATSK